MLFLNLYVEGVKTYFTEIIIIIITTKWNIYITKYILDGF